MKGNVSDVRRRLSPLFTNGAKSYMYMSLHTVCHTYWIDRSSHVYSGTK